MRSPPRVHRSSDDLTIEGRRALCADYSSLLGNSKVVEGVA